VGRRKERVGSSSAGLRSHFLVSSPPRFISSALFLSISLALATLLYAGCTRGAPQNNQVNAQATPQPTPQEIIVAAAANLTDAFTELGKQFTAKTDIRIIYSFGATAELSKQIENGAPFDVFASADVEHVDKLASRGFISPGTNKLYARGLLVLWIPPGSSVKLSRIEEITRAEVERISIATPELAPYGRATVEALRALNLWQQVQEKVIYGQNVSQTKQYASTGNAEVAFIPKSLVKANEGESIEVDESLHQPINQAIAVVKDSRNQEAAHRFVEFILSPEGQALLERYGYKRP